MNLYQRIKELTYEKKMSLAELERKLDLSNGAISKWKRNAPNVSNLVPVADFFDVSVDFLLGRTNNRYSFSSKEKFDIADQVNSLIEALNSEASVNFYGEPMTKEQRESMKDIITLAMSLNKEKAKKKKNE